MVIGYLKIFFKQGIVTEGDSQNVYMLNEFGKRNWKLHDISRYQPYETDITYAGKIYTFSQEFTDTTERLNNFNNLLNVISQINSDNPKFENLNKYVGIGTVGIYLEYNKEQFDLVIESW